MLTVALFGAGGKMGLRCAENLNRRGGYHTLYVEVSEQGIEALRHLGLVVTPGDEAARTADVVVLAVPDVVIGAVAKEVVPYLKSGAMLMALDPCAAYAGEFPERADVTYFIAHPCHPFLYTDEDTPEGRADHFGGIAKQPITCALMQGPESDYAVGAEIASTMFAPVNRVHRITVEQMAILEPALVETLAATLMVAIHEGFEEVVRMGVPREAALDMLFGHLNVELGILFGFVNARFSDGAYLTVERGRKLLLQPDWKDVLKIESVQREVRAIIEGSTEV